MTLNQINHLRSKVSNSGGQRPGVIHRLDVIQGLGSPCNDSLFRTALHVELHLAIHPMHPLMVVTTPIQTHPINNLPKPPTGPLGYGRIDGINDALVSLQPVTLIDKNQPSNCRTRAAKRYPAIMGSGVVFSSMALGQQEIVFSHSPVDSFAVDWALPVSMPAITNYAPDTAEAVAAALNESKVNNS